MKHFWKNKQILERTTDNREYKITRNNQVSLDEGMCNYCPPHGGCNYWRKGKPQRSWKKYRKTQWREKPHTDSCNEPWTDETVQGYNHMSHEKYEEGDSSSQQEGQVRSAA